MHQTFTGFDAFKGRFSNVLCAILHIMILSKLIPSKFWAATATLVGSIVGVGVFGIPFVFSKAGFGLGFLFLVFIGATVIIVNLLYGEIVLRTHQRHQFVGYVRKYLGPFAHWVNLFNFWVAVFGATTAIMIINGEFLARMLAIVGLQISPVTATTIFVVGAGMLVYRGLKTVSRVDFFMMLLFVFVVLLIGLSGAQFIKPSNFSLASVSDWFLPFGIILFSLQGIQGIPLTREVLIGSEQKLRSAIALGTAIPILLYLLFAIFVVGISGSSTSVDAISGLSNFLGPGIVFMGALFGFLTSGTIFLSIGVAFKESLWQDFGLHKKFSFLLLLIPAYVLFLAGVRNFIGLMGLVGGVAVSVDFILLIMVYVKAKRHGDRVPEYSVRLHHLVLYGMMLMFIAGAIYTLVS